MSQETPPTKNEIDDVLNTLCVQRDCLLDAIRAGDKRWLGVEVMQVLYDALTRAERSIETLLQNLQAEQDRIEELETAIAKADAAIFEMYGNPFIHPNHPASQVIGILRQAHPPQGIKVPDVPMCPGEDDPRQADGNEDHSQGPGRPSYVQPADQETPSQSKESE